MKTFFNSLILFISGFIIPYNIFCQEEDFVVRKNETRMLNKSIAVRNFKMENNSVLIIESVNDKIDIISELITVGFNCEIKLIGENGADGYSGEGYKAAHECEDGKDGGDGGHGKPGKSPPILELKGTLVNIGSLRVNSIGGEGGDGGDGGKGERGGNADDDTFNCACGAGKGGKGGNGGNAGDGANGSDFILTYQATDEIANDLINRISYSSIKGIAGSPGDMGIGGDEGPAKDWCKQKGYLRIDGKKGQIIFNNPGSGKFLGRRYTEEKCDEYIETHVFVISAFENEKDSFYIIKNKLNAALQDNLLNVTIHELTNPDRLEVLDLFDKIKNADFDDIDPEFTQLLIVFIGHGRFEDESQSFYFISQPTSEKILLDDVITRIEKSPFKNKLTLINSCSSGKVINDYPFVSTNIIAFNPFDNNHLISDYACIGKSSVYITSSYNKEKSSKTDFLSGIIFQLENLQSTISANQLYINLMSSEYRMDGVRPVIGKPNYSMPDSSFIFIKNN